MPTSLSAPDQNGRVKAKITNVMQQLDHAITSLDEHHQQSVLLQKQFKALIKAQKKTLIQFITYGGVLPGSGGGGIGGGSSGSAGGDAAAGGQEALLNATRQMQETQMAFNLQYLQLQAQMQQQNRAYSAISSIMKTKHDTVKNSVSNIR